MEALLSAFGIVFLAELGDKSMLFSLTAATRYRWWIVLLAVSVATALLMALAVLAGGIAGEVLPDRLVAVVAAALFIGFGVWTLLDDDEDDETAEALAARSRTRIFFALTGVFFLAELGDKTQIATLSLAGLHSRAALLVWVGATAGMVAVNALAIVAGARLQRYLSPRFLRPLAAVLFLVVGALTLLFAFA
jgi:putative Ca2+/H+ antiporter (TMEM165/GDT1 family)